jgi:hypothetical protein
MQQEATQEFVVRQSGELLFVVVSGITPAKSHLAIGKGDQSMVGDGHAMGVAAEILQHIFGAAKGTFQVDDPVLSKQWPEPSSEDLGFGEQLPLFGNRSSPFWRACRKTATNLPRKTDQTGFWEMMTKVPDRLSATPK